MLLAGPRQSFQPLTLWFVQLSPETCAQALRLNVVAPKEACDSGRYLGKLV